MLTAILVLAGLGGLALIGAWFLDGVKSLGVEEERLRRVDADLRAAKKQAEIMAQNKSAEDVANDLDRGTF